MANYKKITDAVAASEVTENMNVLVEDGGSLRKISLGNVGSGDVTTLIFRENGFPSEGSGIYICENDLTLNQLRAMFMQGVPVEAFVKEVYGAESIYVMIDKIELGEDYISFQSSKTSFTWTESGISVPDE